MYVVNVDIVNEIIYCGGFLYICIMIGFCDIGK